MTPAERERVLAALRAPRPVPAALLPQRLARPGELPPAASTLLRAAVEPWTARAYYSLGSAPYSWSEPGHRYDGGHRLVAAASIRLRHPDGRAAYALWVSDAITQSSGPRLPKGVYGPREAGVWGQAWRWQEGRRWRICTCPARASEHPASVPVPIGATDLRTAVSVPDHQPAPIGAAA